MPCIVLCSILYILANAEGYLILQLKKSGWMSEKMKILNERENLIGPRIEL